MQNPIEQCMAAGMSAIAAFLTEATCGEACWEAREDICRCSCGGKNHGCMRTADGTRPTRTAKIDGYRYELKAVGNRELYEPARHVNGQHTYTIGSSSYRYHYSETDKGAFARIKSATKQQFAAWPELKAAREVYEAKRATATCAADYMWHWPYLLWVRVDHVEAS